MPYHSTIRRLGEITEEQWGLVTRRQAELSGISPATLQRLSTDGVLDRVAHGVYALTGAPRLDHLDLRAAWLQLAPEMSAWERTAEHGVISHRSAAELYGLGHLPADRNEFTFPVRRQSRRPDVRLHLRSLQADEWVPLRGLPVTRPSRIAADLLDDDEDMEAVAQVVADAIRGAHDYPGTFAHALGRYAGRLELHPGDGLALLGRLLGMVGDRESNRWMREARNQLRQAPASLRPRRRLVSGQA